MKREIPNNIEAEQSVLGSMFLSKEAVIKALESLSQESFYLDKHGKIFEAIRNLYNSNVAIDLTTVTNELKNKQELDAVGGIEYLTEILDQTPTAANIDHYINIVSDKSILRNLIDEATNIATLGYSNEFPVPETLDKAEAKILNVVKNRKSKEFRTMPEVLTTFQANLEELASNKGKISGLPTGLYDFDNLTDGLHENELIIIAARPSMGKTALALNIATNVALNTKKTISHICVCTLALTIIPFITNKILEGFSKKDENKVSILPKESFKGLCTKQPCQIQPNLNYKPVSMYDYMQSARGGLNVFTR